MRPAAFFVTGTDTGVGKTLVAAALLRAATARGLRTLGLKPVAAGCDIQNGKRVNSDALVLQQAATERLEYGQVNPVALEPAIAPHIAAARVGIKLTAEELVAHCRNLDEAGADLIIVEGAGGWLVPLNDSETLADVAAGLNIPVILVVGMKLGCVNHALLTAGAVRDAGLDLAGWVANCIDPDMPALKENIDTLAARLPGPHLGIVPFLEQGSRVEDAVQFIDTGALF